MTEDHPARPAIGKDRWGTATDLKNLLARDDCAVVVDRKVMRLHGLLPPDMFQLTAGERSKSFATLERICNYLNRRRLSGAKRIVAAGGGSIGDVVGLAAHLVKRGMKLTMVPSTVLAAVDSSLGGKTAINAGDGTKNAFGAYHFHDETLIVPELWTTLARDQIVDGQSEAVKMALCLDAEVAIKWSRATPELDEMVREGRRIKRVVCEVDPFEEIGKRFVLNFGHTLGHVVETLNKYKISHGICVAIGMRAALDIGLKRGTTSELVWKNANQLLDHFALPSLDDLRQNLEGFTWQQIRELLNADKKGSFNFVLLEEIGSAVVVKLEPDLIKNFISSLTGGGYA